MRRRSEEERGRVRGEEGLQVFNRKAVSFTRPRRPQDYRGEDGREGGGKSVVSTQITMRPFAHTHTYFISHPHSLPPHPPPTCSADNWSSWVCAAVASLTITTWSPVRIEEEARALTWQLPGPPLPPSLPRYLPSARASLAVDSTHWFEIMPLRRRVVTSRFRKIYRRLVEVKGLRK